VGFVTPSDAYAQLGQSDTESAAYITEQTSDGVVVSVGGPWQRYEAGDTRSLVRVIDGVTIVVSGTADWNELTTLADRLSPQALPNPA